jgi:alpha-L-glutamate ligase-like protein
MIALLKLLLAPKDRVMGINRRNLQFVATRNARRHFDIADDKLLAKQVLSAAGVPVSETLATFSSFSELRLLDERIGGLDEFVVKPARGHGGQGILVIAGRDGEFFITAGGRRLRREELARHIADIVFGVYALDKADVAMVEPRLKPSRFFADLYADGLSDVRVILVDDRPALSMIRVPTKASDGRANLHQGALGLGLVLEDGTIHRAYCRGQLLTHHPDNGEALIGRKIPGWTELLAIAVKAARAVPLKYLGVDIVVDRARGPLMLEINARPGLEIQNVNGVPLRERLASMGVA